MMIIPGMMIHPGPCKCVAQLPCMTEDLRHFQNRLKKNEAMLEYRLTDSSLLINAIDRESQLLITQSLDRLFWYSLKSFRKKLTSAEPGSFLISGEILYVYLVRPLQDFLTGRRRLIIKPGEKLKGLPFEALIRNDRMVEGNPGGTLHYLIHDFEVVYQNSTDSRDEDLIYDPGGQSISADDCRVAFMGFSPAISKENKCLAALPGSESEIAGIGALFAEKGLSSYVDGASGDKDLFKTMAGRGRIIHLATHSISERQTGITGGLLFACRGSGGENSLDQKGILTADEFKSMRLEADLIVLNACATGTEDPMPDCPRQLLPELLSGVGARNVISTLWNVTDNLAACFMLDFYREVLSGKTYSQALREVKLQWINCRATAMPTIWAAYVLTGK